MLKVILTALMMAAACSPSEKAKTEPEPEPEQPAYDNSFSLMGRIDSPGAWKEGEVLIATIPGGEETVGKAYLTDGAGTQAGTFDLKTNLLPGDKVVLKRDAAILATQKHKDAGNGDIFKYSPGCSGEVTLDENWPAEFTLSQDYSVISIVPVAGDLQRGSKVSEISLSCSGAALSDGGDRVTVSLDSPLVLSETEQGVDMIVKAADLGGKDCSLEILGGSFPFMGINLEKGAVNTLKVVLPDAVLSPAKSDGPEFTTGSVEYKSKVENTSYMTAQVLTVDGMNRMPKYAVDPTDRWGGYAGVKPDSYVSTNTAGFWRTGKYKGRWVCVNPDGNVTILHGINGATPPFMKESVASQAQTEYERKFSSLTEWARFTNRVLTGTSFNFMSMNAKRIRLFRSYVSEAEQAILRGDNDERRLGHVEIVYLLRTFSWDYNSLTGKSLNTDKGSVFTLMFDPAYLDYIDELAKDATSLFKEDKAFIGYYTDNELGFRFSNADTPGIYLKQWLDLDTSSSSPRAFAYAKQYAEKFIRDNYGVEPLAANVTTAMDEAFLSDICEYYYRTAAAAIRKYDPNHLILGSRLHGKPKALKQVHAACAKYCDIVSVNVYGTWEPNDDYFISNFKTWVNDSKPCFVTEFYTRDALNTFNGELYGNTGEGGGWIVKGQASRGKHYQNFTRKLISYDHCIGWQWFQMTDDYLETYGWNNKGIINPAFEVYTPLTDMMRQLHWNIYQIMDYYHSPSGASGRPAEGLRCVYWE